VALSVQTRNHGQGENYEPVQLVKLFLTVNVRSVLCMQLNVFVFLQTETSQEASAMQETRRMEEVIDSGLEMLTIVICLEIAFIFDCLIVF
jgi:hypothetical protein